MNLVFVALSGAGAVFLLFFLLLWAADRQPRLAAQIAGLIALNLCTAVLAASLLDGMAPALRRVDDTIFWLIGVLWIAGTLGAIYAPWHFFGNRPR